jgi:hypothetical protein
LLFQSPQGYEFQHRFANGDKIILNDIDYQVNGNQLIAIRAREDVTDGDQLIRYCDLKRGVGVRFSTPLNESKLSLDNDTLSINRLTRLHLPERTLIYFGEQAFPLKALQYSVHRHRQPRDLSHVDVVIGLLRRFSVPWWSTARSQRFCAMTPSLDHSNWTKTKFPPIGDGRARLH